MKKFLGIDYGTKKIGFALSDEEGKIAFPRDTNPNIWKHIHDYISKIITNESVTEIVIGLPIGLDGKETDLSREVRTFAKKLEGTFKLPVHFENEVYSSAAVKTAGAAPFEKIDASSAALILQTWLDRRARQGMIQ